MGMRIKEGQRAGNSSPSGLKGGLFTWDQSHVDCVVLCSVSRCSVAPTHWRWINTILNRRCCWLKPGAGVAVDPEAAQVAARQEEWAAVDRAWAAGNQAAAVQAVQDQG
jgi:hypothetical protein